MKATRLISCAALLAMLSGVLGAGDAKDDAVKKERKRFEGTWQVESIELNGMPFSEDQAKAFKVINEADGKWAIEQGGKVVSRGTSVVDPTQKPKTVDLEQTEGDGKGQTLLGIYEFDGDTRKVCFASPGKARPTEFSAPTGSMHILAVLKKIKK
jgi:uncharacterized protein (TIGR03067 family)